jgi:hypothetical protein
MAGVMPPLHDRSSPPRAIKPSALFVLLLALLACSPPMLDLGTSSTRSFKGSEQVNSSCPSTPRRLTGSGSPGATCTTERDCAPTCCSCGSGARFLGAACVDGRCASQSTACSLTTEASLCGGPDGSTGGGPGGNLGGGGGSSASSCVAGSSYACTTAGGRWTGTLCCVGRPAECASGSSYSCTTAGGAWTGSVCCIPGEVQCVQGSSYACTTAGGKWTGSLCCVSDRLRCVSGSSYACTTAGGTWTGSLCCN